MERRGTDETHNPTWRARGERYAILSEIGRGGMGVVYRARDEETGSIVAVKVLREGYADDPDYVRRFEREAELAQRIDSIHVVKVLDYGLRDGLPFLALEYVDGPSLYEALMRHGPYSWPETRATLAQLAQGLADANAAGVIHRDIKPSNVLIAPDGTVKLSDFGIARGLSFTRITATSTIVGTPAYLAPEGPKDARSDLYSLGVIGYELLAGAAPFRGATYQEVVIAHIRETPDLTVLPAEARPIIGWLLAKDPADRPQRASALLPVLYGADQPGRGSASPPTPAVPDSPAPSTVLVESSGAAGELTQGVGKPTAVAATAIVRPRAPAAEPTGGPARRAPEPPPAAFGAPGRRAGIAFVALSLVLVLGLAGVAALAASSAAHPSARPTPQGRTEVADVPATNDGVPSSTPIGPTLTTAASTSPPAVATLTSAPTSPATRKPTLPAPTIRPTTPPTARVTSAPTPTPTPTPMVTPPVTPLVITGSTYLGASVMWGDMHVALQTNDAVVVSVSGTYGIAGSDPGKTAEGIGCGYGSNPQAAAQNITGPTVAGRVGASGTPFCISPSASFTVMQSGELYVTINDWPGSYFDNWGGVTVRWQITRMP